MELLNQYEIAEVSRGLFTLTYNPSGETYIVGEQRIIDLARELEEIEDFKYDWNGVL